MARLYQREGSTGWHYDFRFKGRRYRGWAGPNSTKDQAEKLMVKRQRELIDGEIYPKRPEPVAFAAFADDFLETDSPTKRSKDRDRSILATLKAEWKGLNLDQVTTKLIEEFKARRLKYRSPATVDKELQVIKRLFRKAVEWRKLPESPAATVRKLAVDNTRVRKLEPEELTRLMEALPDWLRPYAVFAWKSGARRGEILGLCWKDVDFKRGLITFRDTKTGKGQTVHMNRSVRELLESLPAPVNRSQRVFPVPEGVKLPTFLITLQRAWVAACRKAGIGDPCTCDGREKGRQHDPHCKRCGGTGVVSDFHFHDLRHQAATDLLTAGATLNDVRDFLRHRTPAMTLRYAHLVEDRRRATAQLLDAPLPKPPAPPERERKIVGTKTDTLKEPAIKWRPQRDLNPCYRLERAMS